MLLFSCVVSHRQCTCYSSQRAAACCGVLWCEQVMLADIGACKGLGAHGVVVGCLQPDGTVDVTATRRLVREAQVCPDSLAQIWWQAACGRCVMKDVSLVWHAGSSAGGDLPPCL